jgi:hypothetical protein
VSTAIRGSPPRFFTPTHEFEYTFVGPENVMVSDVPGFDGWIAHAAGDVVPLIHETLSAAATPHVTSDSNAIFSMSL